MRVILRIVAVCVLIGQVSAAAADMLDRLQPENLQALHEAIEARKLQRRHVSLSSGYDDARALLHVHSAFSHDSRGTIDEIIAAAKKAGVRIIMFSEHPASSYDYFIDGHRGLNDGVLLIPGAETGGFLAYPRQSVENQKTESPQAFADLVRSTDGQIFLCHIEERMDWQIDNITGTEIYNTHADYKHEARFAKAFRMPLVMFRLVESLEKYPQEVFGATLDYPADYLKRYDQLCQLGRHTAVAGNDSHHNQVYHAKVLDGGQLLLEDILGNEIIKLDPQKFAPFKLLVVGRKPGDLIFELDLDPYVRSFRHVSTHVLLDKLTEADVRHALSVGRAYVAFDWLADPTGFVYQAERGVEKWPLGSEVPFAEGLRLRSQAPFEGTFKLICNGDVLLSKTGTEIVYDVDKPGVYRVEVWLKLADEDRPWILTNPLYVTAK